MVKKLLFLIILFSCFFSIKAFYEAPVNDSINKRRIELIDYHYTLNTNIQNLSHNDKFLDFYSFSPNATTDIEIAKAKAALDEAISKGHIVQSINPNELTELPIGIRETRSDNVEYSLVITKATFTPEYAIINVYARVKTPQQGMDGGKKELYFGAEGVKLSYKGKIIGDAKLSLLGDVFIPFNKNEWMLTLEGGEINKLSGESYNDKTFVTIDCDGIKELSLKGNVQISRKVLVPLDESGNILPETGQHNKINRVKGDFSIKALSWNDLLVKVSISPFAITKQAQNPDKGFLSFFVNNAVLDLSDLRTDAQVKFPEYYYRNGYLISGAESWRGIYVETLRVGLPQEFKTSDKTNSRVNFSAYRLLLDNYGVSGTFTAENIFPLDRGITNSENAWKYSLDKIGISLAASKIVGAELAGKIQLPIQKNTQEKSETSASDKNIAEKPKTPTGYLLYTGRMTEEDYLLAVEIGEDIDFDIWSAKAKIAKGSSIEMLVKHREFLPKAILSGSLEISANSNTNETNSEGKKDVEFKGIKFQELVLQTKAPFITAQYFGVEGEQKLAGFPASLNNVFVSIDEQRANLGFELKVGLQENKFSATGGIVIHGLIENNDNRQDWKYNGFSLSKLGFRNVDVGVAIVSGYLKLMRNDPLYGNGFQASLEAEITALKGVRVGVDGIFGNSTFRYWAFDGFVDGLNIGTGWFKVTGFTGGAYYRMVPVKARNINDIKQGNGPGHLIFKPDENMGLSLRAGVLGNVGTKTIASVMAGFNIDTYKNGGIKQVGFLGEALILSDFTLITPKPFDKLQDKFTTMVNKSNFIKDIANDQHTKSFLDVSEVDENYPVETTTPSTIYGKLAMNYDFNNRVLHANLDVKVNSPEGFIRGVGEGGRAGWAVLHIGPQDWYLHIGTPADMIGLRVGFGKLYLESKSYLMVGNHIPESPAPPVEVAQILGVQLDDIDYMKNLNALGEGKGFAFGSHFKFDTGDMTALFLYARFQAGLGADVMLKDYGKETKCTNRGGDAIGINGWYANGQAYVYLQGELGIKIKLFFVRKKIPIIKAGAAALLQAKGPNPYWMRGYLGGHYNLLGGLVKGKFRFKLEFGEECKLENESVLGGMKIITDFTPKKDEKDIDVFAVPQATFAFRVNEPIVIPEDDGDHIYKIVVEKMTILDEKGNEIKGKVEYTKSKDVANFVSEDILPPNKSLKAIVQVSFMEEKNGIFQVVMDNGQKAVEIEERNFTTGSAPNKIPLSNIQYAYPVINQNNFYTKENNKGYIKLKRGQDYLFDDPNWNTASRFKADNDAQESNFSYNNSDNIVSFEIPNLDKQKEYTFAILAKSKSSSNYSNQTNGSNNDRLESNGTIKNENTSDNSDLETSITADVNTKKAQNLSREGEINRLSFAFRTSKYSTFEHKVSSLGFNSLWVPISSDVLFLQNNMNTDEAFDEVELIGNQYTENKPLVDMTALMDDEFANKFKNLIYDKYPVDQLKLTRDGNEDDIVGIPPIKALTIFPSYLQYLDKSRTDSFLTRVFPYQYDLFRYYKADWYELVSKASSKYVNIPLNSRPQIVNQLIQSTYGIIPKGKYRVKAQYLLPGNKAGSQKEIVYQLK